MEPRQLKAGDVVQIKPRTGNFSYCLATVDRPPEDGVITVYVGCPSHNGLPEALFQRVTFADIEYIGESVFQVDAYTEEG